MLKNLKIGSRLRLGFAIILVLMIIMGGYALSVISSLDDRIDNLVELKMVQTEQATQINDNLNIIALGLRNIIVDDNKDHQSDELRRIAESRKTIAGFFIAFIDFLWYIKNVATVSIFVRHCSFS